MPTSHMTTFVRLAVRSTGKSSTTAAFTAARNAGVSIFRALNTSAISEPDTSSDISQQQQSPPKYAFKSVSAKLRSFLKTRAETSSDKLFILKSKLRVKVEDCEAAILLNIENAERSNDEEYVADQIAKAFELILATKREEYSHWSDEIYGHLLHFFIDMEMVEEFDIVVDAIRNDSDLDWSRPELARLGYYKMLLWIKLKDEEKIKEVCSMIIKSFKEKTSEVKYPLHTLNSSVFRRGWEINPKKIINKRCLLSENYLIALCDEDQHKEVLRILETLDITREYDFDVWTSIFEHLGRSLSESVAKKLLHDLNENEKANESTDRWYRGLNVPKLLFSYVTSIPNMTVGDAVFKFNELLKELKISPSTKSYHKLIKYCCNSGEEDIGLSILQQMHEVGLEVPSESSIYLFRTIEKKYGFNLLKGVQDVLQEMHNNGDESRMFNLRLAEYILEVLFGRCEQKQKERDPYKPWLMNSYLRGKLDDYKRKYSKKD